MNKDTPDKESFTGYRRSRSTRSRVLVANTMARTVISLGGIATILAVLLVCVFLVAVVVPLFLPPDIEPSSNARVPAGSHGRTIVQAGMNEYLTMGWFYSRDGVVSTFRLDSGSLLEEYELFSGNAPVSSAFALQSETVAFGFADGTVSYGTIGFSTNFLEAADLTEDDRQRCDGAGAIEYLDGMLERTPEGQYRLQRLRVDLEEPVLVEENSPVEQLDISIKSSGPVIAARTASGILHILALNQRKNLLTGAVTTTLNRGSIALDEADRRDPPSWVLLSGLADNCYLAWRDGRLLRYNTRDPRQPRLAQAADLTPERGTELTALGFQLGKASLVSGDNDGRVRVWFLVRGEGPESTDGVALVPAHTFKRFDSPVTTVAASTRSRMAAIGYADGTTRLFHLTSQRMLGSVRAPDDSASTIKAVAVAPKDDALFVTTASSYGVWSFDAASSEITLSAIFRPVWYEGYDKPAHVWQSSSGTDDFEPKYGLFPLIFGTLKATLYSMLFGLPLALLAAIYTSELMNPKLKMRVKPVIEMMASLPSVVLGFLAALVVAPMVEDVVPHVLTLFATVPFAILLGAYLWQLLPRRAAARMVGYRLAGMFLMLFAGIWLGFLLGPAVERALFAGNIKAWLSGMTGEGTGGWMFLMLPLSCLVVILVSSNYVTPWMRRASGTWSELKVGIAELIKFLSGALAVLAVAYAGSYLLAHSPLGLWNLDPRGGFVDTYIQRNAMIVGFIMGFAIIPIIYTISEDALSAVPEHLRSASLGSGATPWQTAVRIIIPTAASGLFSAAMIGLGRAVGETMIVLMAAGNTPVLDWNIFNGFRTLSANIAVEMPEAVKDSTHYRMLFLAALVLFAMTFVLNTIAELVRQRFRKRAFEL